jgi:hypothetical protein
MKIIEFVEPVFELSDAGIAASGANHGLVGQGPQSAANRLFVKGHHRIAIGFLVTGVDERIE